MDRHSLEQSFLRSALEDIQALAAPRHIDRVAAMVGMDMVEFAKLGPAKMSAVIWAKLELDQITSSRSTNAGASRENPNGDATGSAGKEAHRRFK